MPYDYAPNRPVEFGPNQIVGDIVYGSELLTEHRIPHYRTREVTFDLEGGRPYLVQERRGPRDIIVSELKQLNEAQQRAIVTLFDDMARAGLVWEDGGPANIFLRQLKDGRWMAGVVDTDRIARFGQVSSERLGFYLPAPMAGPLARVNSGVPRTATSAHDYMAKALEYKGWIRYQNGQFVPGRLDPEIVRSKFTLTADVPAR